MSHHSTILVLAEENQTRNFGLSTAKISLQACTHNLRFRHTRVKNRVTCCSLQLSLGAGSEPRKGCCVDDSPSTTVDVSLVFLRALFLLASLLLERRFVCALWAAAGSGLHHGKYIRLTVCRSHWQRGPQGSVICGIPVSRL